MKLTDAEIKAAKPTATPRSLTDGHGLALIIEPTGRKWWRYRYKYNGKATMLSFGTYPDLTLREARALQQQAKDRAKQGINPSRQKMTAENTFQIVARLWWDHWRTNKTERHAGYVWRRLEDGAFPVIGDRQLKDITPLDLVAMAKDIEKHAPETARRVLTSAAQVFRYAIAHGLANSNPAAGFNPSDVLMPIARTNYKRLPESELPELLRKIDAYDGQPLTRLALKLLMLTFVRTGELIGARWEEIDTTARRWTIPAKRMKMRAPHIVPLSDQALSVIEEINALTGGGVLLFPGERANGKAMSNNTILYALYRMGYHSRMTGHGVRGMASTILHEQGYPHEHIELQLAHSKRDAVSASYNHALYLEARARMVQDWADYLTKKGGNHTI